MPIRFVITDKGKAWRIEADMPSLFGKSVGEKLNGVEIKPELDGYELEISGGSDDAGFPMAKDVEGLGLKRVLLTKGFGMRSNIEGIRLRKTVRGKVISEKTAQLNLKILKHGHKKLEEIFPEQNKPKEKLAKAAAPAAAPAVA